LRQIKGGQIEGWVEIRRGCIVAVEVRGGSAMATEILRGGVVAFIAQLCNDGA